MNFPLFDWIEELRNPERLWKPSESLPTVITPSGGIDTTLLFKPSQRIESLITKPTYQQLMKQLWDTMVVHDNVIDGNGRIIISDVKGKIEVIVDKMIAGKLIYQQVAYAFPNPIKWYHICPMHQMEGELNFNTYLGNGQSIFKKTTIVPKGRGPFSSFYYGAIDAIRYDKLDKIMDWSIGNTLTVFTGFNGFGYYLYRGINTPYVFSGTNHYTKGKYVSDGKYDPNCVSAQIGIAPIFKRLLEKEKIQIT